MLEPLKIAIVDDDAFYSRYLQEKLDDTFYCDITCYPTFDRFIPNATDYNLILLDLNFEFHNKPVLLNPKKSIRDIKLVNKDCTVFIISGSKSNLKAMNNRNMQDGIVRLSKDRGKLTDLLNRIHLYGVTGRQYPKFE